MTAPEPGWDCLAESSYSGTNGDCVQVAPTPDRVLVRDELERRAEVAELDAY